MKSKSSVKALESPADQVGRRMNRHFIDKLYAWLLSGLINSESLTLNLFQHDIDSYFIKAINLTNDIVVKALTLTLKGKSPLILAASSIINISVNFDFILWFTSVHWNSTEDLWTVHGFQESIPPRSSWYLV